MATLATERVWCVMVPHHPLGAGMARHRLAAELAGGVAAETLADTITVVAELVGNSIRHARPLAGGLVRVAWSTCRSADTRKIEVRVTDGGGLTTPHRRTPRPNAPDGRGIAIIEALTTRWGVERDRHGQTVWAELARQALS